MTNGGNPPDVMELSGNWPYTLGGGGALQPLNCYIGSWRNDAFTNSFEVGTYKGNVYAVPFSISPHGFWYSKDLMTQAGLDATKPPTTMDELNSQMATLRAKLPSDAYPNWHRCFQDRVCPRRLLAVDLDVRRQPDGGRWQRKRHYQLGR